jgi:hypothetical protein
MLKSTTNNKAREIPHLRANCAPTDCSPIIVTVHVGDVPLHAPVQPRKVCFRLVLAVSKMLVPTLNAAEHCFPQLIPFGLPTTVPAPVTATFNVYCCEGATNVAATDRVVVIVVSQVPRPAQSPLHPVKTLPPVGVAVSETGASTGRRTEHVAPQSIPLPVTTPVPFPCVATDSDH